MLGWPPRRRRSKQPCSMPCGRNKQRPTSAERCGRARRANGGRKESPVARKSVVTDHYCYFQDRGNMKLWKSAVVVLLFALLVGRAWSQNEPQSPTHSNSVDNLSLQVADQNHDQPQTAPAQ